jgi:hypothetical protein
MKTFSSLKTQTKFAFLLVITSLFFLACKKTSDVAAPIDPVITITPPDLTTKVTTALVSGFVTDGNDVAVKDASVLIGTATVLTDKYGYFEARNVQMVQNAAVVTVSKTGFFKGIKTYIATANKSAFFRIKLIPKTSAGTMNAIAGGAVTLASGLSINFPASAIVNASTNAAYTGVVTVAAFYINPTATDLNSIMPGDLRGLNTDGNLQLLTSFGMVAVELTGAGGELLQIATGKKATLTMPIPTALSATAPASIPLWYFNETNGLWKQEGSATKTGNTYVGDVSHFSFWNCDRAVPYVIFNATVTNFAGLAVSNALVKVFLASEPNDAHFGYTDAQGYISGGVPVNAQLIIQVVGEWGCNNALYSQNFTTGTTDISLGNLVLPTSATAEVSGKVVDCNAIGVANGSLIMFRNGMNLRYPVTNNGVFSFITSVCSAGSSISLIGQDLALNVQSPQTNFTINSGINNTGNLTACTINTSTFVNFSVNGNSYVYTSPVDNIGLNGINNGYEVFAGRIPDVVLSYARFRFSNVGIGTNTNVPLLTYNSTDVYANGSVTPNSVMVNITEFGPVNGYISGNFSGTINNTSAPNSPFAITCSFRVLRWF